MGESDYHPFANERDKWAYGSGPGTLEGAVEGYGQRETEEQGVSVPIDDECCGDWRIGGEEFRCPDCPMDSSVEA